MSFKPIHMKRKILPILLFSVLIISACSAQQDKQLPQEEDPQQNDNVIEQVPPKPLSLAEQSYQAINETASVSETASPNLTPPSDINSAQIQKYFKMGDIYFALVQRNSINVWLELPKGFTPSFAGILIAKKDDTTWTKMTEIKDAKPTDKNNPYYLTVKDGKLLLTVVDQNGAGSGEGIMKVFSMTKTASWNLENCYYFGASYSDPSTDGDMFAYSIKFSEQETKPLDSCKNIELTTVK